MVQKFLELFKSQNGFSLTEVMIGGAILAGVALGSAHLFKNQKTAQKNIELDQRLAIYHSQLSRTMGIAGNCNATFKSLLPTSSAVTAGSVSTLYHCVASGTNKCVDDNSVAGGSFDAYTPGAYAGTTLISAGGFIDGTNTWKVSSMSILLSQTTTGPNTLRVTYAMNPSISNRTMTKDIPLNLRFAGGTFRECYNSSESNTNNLQSDLCKTLNFQEAGSSDGRIAVWNSVTQTCDLQTTVKDCSSAGGLVVDASKLGDVTDGSVRCKPTVDTSASRLEATRLQQTAPAQVCPAGTRPTVIFNYTDFEIICH